MIVNFFISVYEFQEYSNDLVIKSLQVPKDILESNTIILF